MKERIITLFIGILIGTILTTGAFFIYVKISSPNQNERLQRKNRVEMNVKKSQMQDDERKDKSYSTDSNQKVKPNTNNSNEKDN